MDGIQTDQQSQFKFAKRFVWLRRPRSGHKTLTKRQLNSQSFFFFFIFTLPFIYFCLLACFVLNLSDLSWSVSNQTTAAHLQTLISFHLFSFIAFFFHWLGWQCFRISKFTLIQCQNECVFCYTVRTFCASSRKLIRPPPFSHAAISYLSISSQSEHRNHLVGGQISFCTDAFQRLLALWKMYLLLRQQMLSGNLNRQIYFRQTFCHDWI